MSRRISALFTWRTAVTGDGSDATALERHVALTLALFMSEAGDSAFPSVATLAGRCARSESTVRGALRELERKGWLDTAANRGRGHTNVYRTSIPDDEAGETRLTPSVSDPGGGPSTGIQGGAERAPAGRPVPALSDPQHDRESRRSPVGLVEGDPAALRQKTAGDRHENRRRPAPTTSRTTSVPRQQQQTAATDDAAAAGDELERRLRGHGVGGDLLAAALIDRERAEAWITLAESRARDNVGGFFRAGLESGDWPGPRRTGIRAPMTTDRRREQITQLVENLGAEHGPDEARWRIDHEWDTLTQVERSELHELVDELASAQLPDPATTSAAEVA